VTIEQNISNVFEKALNAIAGDPRRQSQLTSLLVNVPLEHTASARQSVSTEPTLAIDLSKYNDWDFLKKYKEQVNERLSRLGIGKQIGNSEWLFNTQAMFAVPNYKGTFTLEMVNKQFITVRFVPFSPTGFLDKALFNDSSYFQNITNKLSPLSSDDFADIIAKYVREKLNVKAPVPPFQKNEIIWIVSKDNSLKPKMGQFEKYIYDKQTDTGVIKIKFKARNSDGTYNNYSKNYDYPSSLYDYYSDADYQKRFGAKSPQQSLIRSSYTLVFDRPYHSNPPPVSPLANAYYGSDAYTNGSDPNQEIDLSSLAKNITTPPKCPQITSGYTQKVVVANPHNGQCIMVKNNTNAGQASVETFCSHVSRALGFHSPDMRFENHQLFSALLPTDFNEINPATLQKILNKSLSSTDPQISKLAYRQAIELFVIGTWLANWDIMGGTTGYNTMFDPNGNLSCIDWGGALMYGGAGAFKDIHNLNPQYDAEMKSIQYSMKEGLKQFGIKSTFVQVYGKSFKIDDDAEKIAIFQDITDRIMMLFHPQYNYIAKLTAWTNLPQLVKKSGYKPFNSLDYSYTIANADEKELQNIFVVWLQARAYALWKIARGK
jgi:hypothetical protein